MTARFFWNQRNTRGHRPRLQSGKHYGTTLCAKPVRTKSGCGNFDRVFPALLKTVLLPSLNAIHLATALSLRGDIGVVVTYDAPLSAAAAGAKPAVSAPA